MLVETRFEFLFIISLIKNIKKYIFDTFSGILESFQQNTKYVHSYILYKFSYAVGLKITQINRLQHFQLYSWRIRIRKS